MAQEITALFGAKVSKIVEKDVDSDFGRPPKGGGKVPKT